MAGGLAVVLSGGGAKGAFQVGVLDALIRTHGTRFDHFVGVSTGSIQALGGAMDDMPGLVAHWESISGNGDIFKKRLLGFIGGLLGAPSLYKAGPLKKRLADYADVKRIKEAGRTLHVGTVDLGSKKFHALPLHEVPDRQSVADWVYASCAQPPYFEPFERIDAGRTVQWVDGGVRDVTPLSTAMKLSPRAIVVVIASPKRDDAPPSTEHYGSLLEINNRCSAILVNEVATNDVEHAEQINGLLRARKAQADALAAQGLSGAAAKAVLDPLDAQIANFKLVPVLTIRPTAAMDRPDTIPDTMEFDPGKIRNGIAAGRRAVEDDWARIGAFLSENAN